MRLTDVRDLTVKLDGGVANAVVNFSEHTVSLVAVVTDVVRNGRPVIGLGFNSIGRFAQSGILRDRVVVNGDHAEANVTTFMAYAPQTRSTRSFDLQFRDNQWKICQAPDS